MFLWLTVVRLTTDKGWTLDDVYPRVGLTYFLVSNSGDDFYSH